MSSKKYPGTLVFDLDGTLVDSVRDLIPSLNRTIATQGLQPISRSDAGHVVGQGVVMMIKRAFEFHDTDIDEELIQELLKFYLQDYEEHIADKTVFFDGCLSALDDLATKGWKLAVCTNKFEHLAIKLLRELGELERFSAVAGGDTFDVRKPDPGHIIQTILKAGGDPARSVMVGDSLNDIAAARDGNIPVIAVNFGYTDVPVTELNPDIVISHYCDLEKSIDLLSENHFA